nr:DnaJ protein JJJ1 homolog [Ipomoea batatas]
MASPDKRCLYEVLGVSRDCSPDEIRSAYKKLALQRHPDKLVQSGVPESEATAAFQELVNAYEVLSDPRERSWYDSNRSKILFSSSTSGPNSSSKFGSVPNLFSFFSNSVYSGFSDTGKGFYKVYADVFDKVYHNEVNFAKTLGLNPPKEAPLMGNSNSPYAQVTAFYNYWLGFTTVMDFCWVDQYDAMAGINRKSRRVMEDENKKLRKKARREYNETVRGLAEFVKKRDKRVIDMQVKRSEEMERKREEEQARKKELERLKKERAKKYEEPDWTQVEDVEDEAVETWEEDDGKEEGNELYCIACGKKFKSEKQWKNHEQSKKHKEKVAALREAFSGEDKEFEEIDVNGRKEEEEEEEPKTTPEADESGYFSATDDAIDELGEQFEGSFGILGKSVDDDDDEEFETAGKAGYTSDGQDSKGAAGESGSDDDEASILEAMVSGHRSRKNAVSNRHSEIENDDNEMDFMEYNNLKSSGRKRGSRKQRDRRAEEEMKLNEDEPSGQAEKNTGYDENLDVKRSPKAKTDGKEDDSSEMIDKIPRQVNKRGNTKKDNNTKSKNASKGRKEKTTSKVSGNACEKCGEEFESRNKLHKHLGETGHAALKTR